MMPLRFAGWTALAVFGLVVMVSCSSSDNDIGVESANSNGGAACGSCWSIYANGGIVCSPGSSIDAWHALANSCACAPGVCIAECRTNFCDSLPADMACGTCLASKCADAETNCANN